MAALAGRNTTPASWNTLIASKVEGILAPSPTYLTPLATRTFALSSSIPFCVAQGKATSHLIFQISFGFSPYSASLT